MGDEIAYAELCEKERKIRPFLPAHVIDEEHSIDEVLVGKSDVAGFTALTEHQKVIDEESRKQDRMAEAVHRWADIISRVHASFEPVEEIGGVIEYTEGDAVIFTGRNADDLIEASVEAQRRLAEIPEVIGEAGPEYPEKLESRIGLTKGRLYRGVIGTKRKIAVIAGPALEAANRIESEADPSDRVYFDPLVKLEIERTKTREVHKPGKKSGGFIPEGEIPYSRREFSDSELTELDELERRVQFYEQFFPKDIVNAIYEQERAHFQPATIMFAEIPLLKYLTYFAINYNSPEFAKEVNEAFFDVICDSIESEGGWIKNFYQGKVIAAWGVPTPMEKTLEHASAAVEKLKGHKQTDRISEILAAVSDPNEFQKYIERISGLEIRAAVPPHELKKAIYGGINDGRQVFVGVMGERRRSYDIIGGAVNAAARYCQHLPFEQHEGDVNIWLDDTSTKKSRDTIARSKDTIRIREAKGLKGEITLHALERKQRQKDVLIGREKEVERLDEVLDLLFDDHKSRTVHVDGKAGHGKTALTEELERRFKERGGIVYEAESAQHAIDSPDHLMKSLLRDYVNLEDGMSKDDVEMKFLAKVSEEHRGVVNHWLSLGFEYELPQVSSAEELERVRMDAMVALLQNKEPTMIVLSDVHWADEASMKKFSLLQERLHDDVLFVTNYRTTELPEEYRGYVEGETVTVDKFDVDGTKALLEYRLAGVDDEFQVDEELLQLVWEHSDGVALHIAEITTYLEQEACIDDGKLIVSRERADKKLQEVPTLEKVVLARFRRLPKEQQEILRFVSAMYGEELSADLLGEKEDFDEILKILEAKEFLRRENGTIGFNHKLTQHAIYESIHIDHRRELHLEHVTRREKSSEDRLQEFIEELAWQADRTDDDWKAMFYNKQGADRYIDVRNIAVDFALGIRFADKVISREYSKEWNDNWKEVYWRAHLRKAGAQISQGLHSEAECVLDTVLEGIKDISDDEKRSRVHWRTYWNKYAPCFRTGRKEEALHCLDQAERIGYEQMAVSNRVDLLLKRGKCYEDQEKIHYMEKALDVARESSGQDGAPIALSLALSTLVFTYSALGEIEKSLELMPEALEVAEQLDDSMNLVGIYAAKASIEHQKDNLDAAIASYHKAEEYSAKIGMTRLIRSSYMMLARLYAEKGDDCAYEYIEKISDLPGTEAETIEKLEQEVKEKLGQN